MTDKELRKLSRTELLELLIELGRENLSLQERLNKAEEELKQRKLKMDQCGSIAEAALKLNGVFEAAQQAAEQYRISCEQACNEKIAEAERRAEEILAAAQQGRKEAAE